MLKRRKHGWYDSPSIEFKNGAKLLSTQLETVEICGFESNIIENHDELRGVSRFLPDMPTRHQVLKMLGTINESACDYHFYIRVRDRHAECQMEQH